MSHVSTAFSPLFQTSVDVAREQFAQHRAEGEDLLRRLRQSLATVKREHRTTTVVLAVRSFTAAVAQAEAAGMDLTPSEEALRDKCERVAAVADAMGASDVGGRGGSPAVDDREMLAFEAMDTAAVNRLTASITARLRLVTDDPSLAPVVKALAVEDDSASASAAAQEHRRNAQIVKLRCAVVAAVFLPWFSLSCLAQSRGCRWCVHTHTPSPRPLFVAYHTWKPGKKSCASRCSK